MIDFATPKTYSDVFARLERDGGRYVVISGVAVCLHGHPRPIADLDIVISPVPEESNRTLHVLAQAGFVPSLPLPLSMVSVLRMFDAAGREVDVFVRYHIPFDEMWAASELRGVGDGVVRIVSLEHLLQAKRINGRPHDLLDIDALLALTSGDG
jgi:hypothetical protein